MKPEIHPKYNTIEITCLACSTKFSVGSTRTSELKTEVCSNCHPFFTGKLKFVDTAGRIEKFKTKFAGAGYASLKKGKKAAPAPAAAEPTS